MRYIDYKNKYQKAFNKLFEKNKVFFAFSNERFLEQNPKREKVYSLGQGGFIFTRNWDKFIKDAKKMNEGFEKYKKLLSPKEVILYELRNHESFYTGKIDEVFKVVKDFGYTYKMVNDIYLSHKR